MRDALYLLPDAALFVVLARMVWIGAHETARREFLWLLGWFSYSVLSLSAWFPRALGDAAWPTFCLTGAWLTLRGLKFEIADLKTRAARTGIGVFLILYYGGAFLGLGAAALSVLSTACWMVMAWFIGPRPEVIFNLERLGWTGENFEETAFSWRPVGVSSGGRREITGNQFPAVVPPGRQAALGWNIETPPGGPQTDGPTLFSMPTPRSAACLPPLPNSELRTQKLEKGKP